MEQNTFTLKQIQRLMALYSKAVEFYNGKTDGKYLYYQDKIHNLITQPNVLDLLSAKSLPTTVAKTPERVETDFKTKENLKNKERRMKLNLHMSNQEMEKQDVKTKIIEDHISGQDQESKIIQTDLSSQSDSLKKRLEMRKQKQKNDAILEASQQTNSSTPNIQSASKDEKADVEGHKSSSSGSNSVDQNSSFLINFENLCDEKFSEELVSKLKLLQEGYDEDEYEDFFDFEDAEESDSKVYNECLTLLNKNEEEAQKVNEENNKEIEQLFEQIANEKFEKIAELRAEYKYRVKFAQDQEEADALKQE